MKIILFFLILSSFSYSKVVLNIGLFDVPPMYFENSKNGSHDGVTFRLFKKIENNMKGYEFKYQVFPYARMVDKLEKSEIDVAIFYSSSKFKKFDALTETLGNDNILIARTDLTPLNLKILEGKTIAIINGAKYEKNFDENKKIFKNEMNSYEQGIKVFLHERVDGLIIPDVAYEYYLRKLKIMKKNKNKLKNSIVLNHKKNWIHVREGLSQKVRELLIQANAQVIKKNGYKRLSDLF